MLKTYLIRVIAIPTFVTLGISLPYYFLSKEPELTKLFAILAASIVAAIFVTFIARIKKN